MKHSKFLFVFLTFVTGVVTLVTSCTKINEATEAGGGLIPPVDNIFTFDTTISVETYNDTFTNVTDSQYLGRSQVFYLGRINNDPFFGKTDAQMFLQLHPLMYGIHPLTRKDSVKIDSVVLVLSYLETYGDTTVPQTVNVYEVNQGSNFTWDSAYLLRQQNFALNPVPLSFPLNQQFVPSQLNDSIKAFRDTTAGQLRIKLDTNFARRFFNLDTSNGYKNDSIFNTYFKGFAVRSEGSGNAIVGINLADVNTKLAFYYKIPKKNSTAIDSSMVNYFFVTQVSAAASYVGRDYSGTPLEATVGGGEDQVVYIQNSPGTFATLKIPALSTIGNRVVHKAELIVEQIYDPSDKMFGPPEVMYLDAYDPSITSFRKFRALPYDMVFDNFGSPGNLNAFGILPNVTKNANGDSIHVWNFNISRYVQHVVNNTVPNFDLRLYAPFTVINKFIWPRPDINDYSASYNLNPTVAKGRIRVGGGNHPTQQMRIRIIYSKL